MSFELALRVYEREEWVTAEVEDKDGNVIGQDTAPVVEARRSTPVAQS